MSPYKRATIKTLMVFFGFLVVFIVVLSVTNLSDALFRSFLFDIHHPYYRMIAAVSTALTILSALVSALLGWRIAGSKNRDRDKWAVLCLVFNLWCVIFLCFLPPVGEHIGFQNDKSRRGQ